jgi:hypothetical protein
MKLIIKQTRVLLLGVLLALGGCGLPSVYPFYTEKDVVFEPGLVGLWIDTKSDPGGEKVSFEKDGEKAYKISDMQATETNVYSAHLFRLGNQLLMDCALTSPEQEIPAHLLLKVEQIRPTFRYTIFSEDWMNKLFEKQPNALRHFINEDSGNKGIVLTADTAELQAFVQQYAASKEAFADGAELRRQ